MPEESQKRQIAYKVRIKDIISSQYVKEEGWTPNFIDSPDGRKISRVNIIGAVVSVQEDKETNYNAILIDDATGKISVRAFGDEAKKLKGIGIGDVVLVIGRPREYGSEKYILLEIIKKIENKKWIDVRKLELKSAMTVAAAPEKREEKIESKIIEENVEEDKNETLAEKIIDYVKKTDKGAGVDFEDILKKFNNEDIVKSLLSKGELFEIRLGKIKVLE